MIKKIKNKEYKDLKELLTKANEEIGEMIKKESNKTLKAVLLESVNNMKNSYGRSDN